MGEKIKINDQTTLELPDGFKFPNGPWTHEKLGEIKYCEVAAALGFFNPKQEPPSYRPALDCTPFLAQIERDNPKPEPQKASK